MQVVIVYNNWDSATTLKAIDISFIWFITAAERLPLRLGHVDGHNTGCIPCLPNKD